MIKVTQGGVQGAGKVRSRQTLISSSVATQLSDMDYGCDKPGNVVPAEGQRGKPQIGSYLEPDELRAMIEDEGHWRTGVTRLAGSVVLYQCEPHDVRSRLAEYYRWFGVGQHAIYKVVTIAGNYETRVYAEAAATDAESFSGSDCIFDSRDAVDLLGDLHERLSLSLDENDGVAQAYIKEFERQFDLAVAAVAAHEAGSGLKPSFSPSPAVTLAEPVSS